MGTGTEMEATKEDLFARRGGRTGVDRLPEPVFAERSWRVNVWWCDPGSTRGVRGHTSELLRIGTEKTLVFGQVRIGSDRFG